jgi:hypothetical protein
MFNNHEQRQPNIHSSRRREGCVIVCGRQLHGTADQHVYVLNMKYF